MSLIFKKNGFVLLIEEIGSVIIFTSSFPMAQFSMHLKLLCKNLWILYEFVQNLGSQQPTIIFSSLSKLPVIHRDK